MQIRADIRIRFLGCATYSAFALLPVYAIWEALARQMFADQSHSIPEICTALGISRATLYRYVKEPEAPT
jgi:hypothetical protein